MNTKCKVTNSSLIPPRKTGGVVEVRGSSAPLSGLGSRSPVIKKKKPSRYAAHRAKVEAERVAMVAKNLELGLSAPDPKTPSVKTRAVVNEDGLTVREQIAVAEVLKGEPAYKACLTAGYSTTTALSKAGDILSRPKVQSALLKAMEEAGITDGLLAKKLVKGLKARKTIFHEGNPVCEVKDFAIRHKYLTTALELRGDLGRRDEGGEGSFEEVLFQVRQRRVLPI